MKVFSKRTVWWVSALGLILLVMPSVSRAATSFLYDVEPLDSAAIAKLDDTVLLDKYVDVMVELEACTTFHNAAGFNPRDFMSYKKLIRYRVDLIREILKRDLDPPHILPPARKDSNDTAADQ